MNNGLAKVKEFVTNHRHPSAAEFIKADAPDFAGMAELLSRLLERPILTSSNANVTTFLAVNDPAPLLAVEGSVPTLAGDQDLIRRLNGLLGAARVHFVESFEWVNLSVPMRDRLIAQEAADLGVTQSEFSKLTHKWVN